MHGRVLFGEFVAPSQGEGLGTHAAMRFLRNGAHFTTGSDFPVEGINPLLGFYAAVTRLDEKGESPHGPGGWSVVLSVITNSN